MTIILLTWLNSNLTIYFSRVLHWRQVSQSSKGKRGENPLLVINFYLKLLFLLAKDFLGKLPLAKEFTMFKRKLWRKQGISEGNFSLANQWISCSGISFTCWPPSRISTGSLHSLPHQCHSLPPRDGKRKIVSMDVCNKIYHI